MTPDDLQRAFAETYPDASGPPRLLRAPGRINLIGEHIDYNDFPVLPMAIDRAFTLAYAPRADSRVRVRNVDKSFPEAAFDNAPAIPPAPGTWGNYCQAAVEGLNGYLRPDIRPGMNVLVHGTIPPAAGLSSSSALVVATSLAYLDVLGKPLDGAVSRIELARLLADAEQYVGTRGGGMDQAIILLGKQGHACKIDFSPLRAECMPVFDDCVFVACNSLVKAEKTGDARHKYNAGPLSCRLITALVERQAREEYGDDFSLNRLAELWTGGPCLTFDEAERLFAQAIPSERTTLADAAARLGIGQDEVRSRYLGDLPEPPGGYPLRARARHQLTEYRRVEQARDALLAGDSQTFGRLMDASHASCAGDYAVSSPELDALAQAARDAGALGARMTGAGFGGCTVNLVPAARLNAFLEQVDRAYYRDFMGLANGAPDEALFPVLSSDGAGYVGRG